MPLISIIKIHDSALKAQDFFLMCHDRAAMSVALLSKKLRNEAGVDGDAIRLECVHSGKKILLLLKDDKPGKVGVAIAEKGDEDGNFIGAVDEKEVDSAFILRLIEESMLKEPEKI